MPRLERRAGTQDAGKHRLAGSHFFLLLIPCAQNQIALPLHSTLIYQGTFVDGHYSAGVPPAADKDHHDHQSQRLIRL